MRHYLLGGATPPGAWFDLPDIDMFYIGDIILESLVDRSVLAEFAVYRIKVRTESRENLIPPLWHIEHYRLSQEQLLKLLPQLAHNINAGAWYIHFYSEKRMRCT